MSSAQAEAASSKPSAPVEIADEPQRLAFAQAHPITSAAPARLRVFLDHAELFETSEIA
jgi:hypothetical protein